MNKNKGIEGACTDTLPINPRRLYEGRAPCGLHAGRAILGAMETKTDSIRRFAFGMMLGMVGGMIMGFHLSGNPKAAWRKYKLNRVIEDLESEIFDRLVQTKRLTEDSYADIVDEVVSSFIDLKRFSEDKASRIAGGFKSRFKEMQKLAKESAQRAREEIEDEDEG
jgi:hypothetical protein